MSISSLCLYFVTHLLAVRVAGDRVGDDDSSDGQWTGPHISRATVLPVPGYFALRQDAIFWHGE